MSLLTHPEHLDILLCVLLLLSSVAPAHSMLQQFVCLFVCSNPGVEAYFYLYLWNFAQKGGACMHVCVDVFTHASCYTKAKS